MFDDSSLASFLLLFFSSTFDGVGGESLKLGDDVIVDDRAWECTVRLIGAKQMLVMFDMLRKPSVRHNRGVATGNDQGIAAAPPKQIFVCSIHLADQSWGELMPDSDTMPM